MRPGSDYDPKVENQAVVRLAIYILWFVVLSSFLLAINTWMIYSLAQGTARLLPQLPVVSILVQLLNFIGPMVLLFHEWYAWDVIFANRIKTRKKRATSG